MLEIAGGTTSDGISGPGEAPASGVCIAESLALGEISVAEDGGAVGSFGGIIATVERVYYALRVCYLCVVLTGRCTRRSRWR